MKNTTLADSLHNEPIVTKKKLTLVLGLLLLSLALLFSCSKKKSADNTPPVTTNAVNIAGMAFSPITVSVGAGTTVTWTNNDNMTHTVTADDNSFDSGNIAPGGNFSKTFSAAGTYTYHCTIHTTMTGAVVVK